MTIERKPRFTLKLQVVFDDGQSFMSGPVADISETGVFIETVMPLQTGTRVRLIPLLQDEDGGVELDGEVVRKADYDLDNHFDRTPGMGIRFIEVSDEQRALISALLARAKEKPKTIG
ncbi:MAG TPA: PilZ domain-containing protein [Myxococcota bacterium]